MSNSELLHLATKAKRLATRLDASSEQHRLTGRLIRDPKDVDAFLRSTVHDAKSEGLLAELWKTGTGLLLLQIAIERASNVEWEKLWNDAHPDQIGQASEGEDFQLMLVWRERVQTLIKECHQEWVLAINDTDEYIGKLVEAGASREMPRL